MVEPQAIASDEDGRAARPRAAAHVTRSALEERLARLRSEVRDPQAGLFGPRSKVWEVNREAVALLGAGRAVLLQLAHPWVAQAIAQHSRTRHDPIGRFRSTFLQVFRMVYGDLPTALRAARAVHALHERITGALETAAGPFATGSAYAANEPEALLWVHATLWDTSVLCFESVVRPLAPGEKAAYYEETRRFAGLFGIPDPVVPPDWPSFRRYVDGMLSSDVLAVSPPAAAMGRFLFRPGLPGTAPLLRRYAELTAWWLPEHLATGFGLERDHAGQRRAEALLVQLGRAWPRLPHRLRYLPPYVEACRRVAGRRGRDPVGEWLSRLWVGRAGAL